MRSIIDERFSGKYPRDFDGSIQETVCPPLREEIINAEQIQARDFSKTACSKRELEDYFREQSTMMYESSFECEEQSTTLHYSIFPKLTLVCEIYWGYI